MHHGLYEFIPQMIDAKDEAEYRLCLLKLISRICDSHANTSGFLMDIRGNRLALPIVSFIEDKAVITGFHTSKGVYNKDNSLKIGDILLSINEIPIDSIVQKKIIYISASNKASLYRDVAMNLLRTDNLELVIKYTNLENDIYIDTILCYPDIFVENKSFIKEKPLFQLLDNNVGYLCLNSKYGGNMPDILALRALIIDLRGPVNAELINGNYTDFYQLYSQRKNAA